MSFYVRCDELIQPKVLAVLSELHDQEALCLALDMKRIAADVVMLSDGAELLQHLQQCDGNSRTPNRRWPDLILLAAELPELANQAWQEEFTAFLRKDHCTPTLLLAASACPSVLRPPLLGHLRHLPDDIIVRRPDAHMFLNEFGEGIRYWLRMREAVHRSTFLERSTSLKSTAKKWRIV